jgi:hypothetical protein
VRVDSQQTRGVRQLVVPEIGVHVDPLTLFIELAVSDRSHVDVATDDCCTDSSCSDENAARACKGIDTRKTSDVRHVTHHERKFCVHGGGPEVAAGLEVEFVHVLLGASRLDLPSNDDARSNLQSETSHQDAADARFDSKSRRL